MSEGPHRGGGLRRACPAQPAAAVSRSARTIFVIENIACETRATTSGSGVCINSVKRRGMICQLTPNGSLHQPHGLSEPPFAARPFQ